MMATFFKKKKNKVLFIVATTILSFFLIFETGLRFFGFTPGALYPHLIFLKDTVILSPMFVVDSEGILTMNPDEFYAKKKLFDSNPGQFPFPEQEISSSIILHSFFEEYNDFYCKKIYKHNYRNNFLDSIPLIIHANGKPTFEHFNSDVTIANDSFRMEVENYLKHPINEQGFKSIPFRVQRDGRKKILLIGDSFTFGFFSLPITNSFADILLSNGFWVYNSGIPGTDPAQYAAIAEKWIPILKPDYVILNFYTGNDFMPHSRELGEGNYIYYPTTNALWIPSFYGGRYHGSFEEAIADFKKKMRMPDSEKPGLNKFISRSSVLTQLWRVSHPDYQVFPSDENDSSLTVTRSYLLRIKKAATSSGSKLIVSLIPHFSDLSYNAYESHIGVFDSFTVYKPQGLTIEDYNSDHGEHLNNSGHNKIADFLVKIIKNENDCRGEEK